MANYGSLINLVTEGMGNRLVPEVGMGITLLSWTDREPMTIVSVSKTGKSFKATRDSYKRTDANGMSECQEYEYTTNPDGYPEEFSMAKNGRFYTKGGMKNGSGCWLGKRERYYDFSF